MMANFWVALVASSMSMAVPLICLNPSLFATFHQQEHCAASSLAEQINPTVSIKERNGLTEAVGRQMQQGWIEHVPLLMGGPLEGAEDMGPD